MVLSIVYPAGHSSSDWGFIISAGISGGAPDSTAIFMFANKILVNKKRINKKHLKSNRGARQVPRAKIDIMVNAPSVWIPTHSMTELNACNNALETWSAKGHAPVYLWIRTKVSESWVYYDFPNVSGTMVDYLTGYVIMDEDELGPSFMKRIIFSHAYTGGA